MIFLLFVVIVIILGSIEQIGMLKEFFKELVRYNILKEVKEVMCPHCQETDIMEISEFKCTSEKECLNCGEYYNPQNINETVYQVNVNLYKRRKFKNWNFGDF